MTLQEVPVDNVRKNPNNPRQQVRESKIEDLAASIDNQGLLQPPLARPVDGGFELVHGERRLRAVRSLGWDTITLKVEDMDDDAALEVSITENLQREDVTAIGEARAYQLLIDEHGVTQTEAADRLGVSQGDISNKLRLLDLPDRLQDSILRKIISPWQARQLARVWGDYWLLDLALDWDLSVREIREIVDDLEDGAESVRFTRELSAAALEDFWGEAPPDADGTTTQVGADGCEEADAFVMYLDGSGDPVRRIHEGETTHGLLWASRTLEDYEADVEFYEDLEVQPIEIHWPAQRVLIGYTRLALAERFDYDGGFDVELVFPVGFFDWGEFRPPAGDRAEVTADD